VAGQVLRKACSAACLTGSSSTPFKWEGLVSEFGPGGLAEALPQLIHDGGSGLRRILPYHESFPLLVPAEATPLQERASPGYTPAIPICPLVSKDPALRLSAKLCFGGWLASQDCRDYSLPG
jgi:hypothetical protein